jgi:hypothetical protein
LDFVLSSSAVRRSAPRWNAAAFLLPWLDRLLAATLSVTVAYGAFVLAMTCSASPA